MNPAGLAARLRALRDELLAGLVERDVAVRLALLAAVAGEHLLLIGPPGTAKSLIARRLHLAFRDVAYFERLLTRFSVPEELFGPLSIKGLEEDRYERLTQAYLPTAGIAFLDEIFKANSAILNALLTLLNEREFDNGVCREATPLITVVGASNELPEGEELDALFDRFLLRLHVGPVSKESFPLLLGLRGETAMVISRDLQLNTYDLQTIRDAIPTIALQKDTIVLLSDLREWCLAEKIQVSDRRWRKIVRLLQASALTNGRTTVSIWDCWLLQYCIWEQPEQRAKVYDWYATRAGASAAMDPSRLTRIVLSWEARLKKDQGSHSQAQDAEGNLIFMDSDGNPTLHRTEMRQKKRDGEPLFLAPDDGQFPQKDRTNGGKGFTLTELSDQSIYLAQYGQRRRFWDWAERDKYLDNRENWLMYEAESIPIMKPTQHKVLYVESCLREIQDLQQQVVTYNGKLAGHIASLHADIHAHLWVTSDFAEPAAQSLEGTRREVAGLLARIEELQRGFEALPREELSPL